MNLLGNTRAAQHVAEPNTTCTSKAYTAEALNKKALNCGSDEGSKRIMTQRVQLECHSGIRAHKTTYGMVFGT